MKLKFLSILILFSGSLAAQWGTDPAVNTSLTIVGKSQDNLHAVSDANGGTIISWDDDRNSSTNSTDIYAHRMNKNGVIKWATNGIAICSYTATQRSSAIADVGQGNSIIVWEDYRNGNADIYAQKVDSLGNILWAANGVPVCSKALNQKNPKVIGDNSGGAIIVWEDSLSNFWDIYAQNINSAGTPLWATNGLSICIASNTQINPKLETDGMGGAIITWQDKRNNADYDIYAQRVDLTGAIQWTTNGVPICTAVNTQSNPRIEPDGSNGAIIGWIDKRNATDNNIYGQRISPAGAILWSANGNLVCNAAGNQSALDIKYIGASGSIFSWKDARTATISIYAQLVTLNGTASLATDGVLISNGTSKSNNPNVISDKQSGAIIAWQDSSSTAWDIKTQRLDPNGNLLWQIGGVTVSNAIKDQINVVQVADNSGGASFYWEDHRNGTDYNIYAHHLYSSGSPDVGLKENSHAGHTIYLHANPITDLSSLTVAGDFEGNTWQLSIFDAQGKMIKKETLQKGGTFHFNTNDYKAGIYFYNITLGRTAVVEKGKFISLGQN